MQTRHQRGVKMETKVRGLLHHGELRRAQREFDRGWEHGLLPHLPLRHPFLLERLDRVGVSRLLSLASGDDGFSLCLLRKIDRRNPDEIGVGIDGEDQVIGFLPEDAKEILREAGEHAGLYEPKLLTVRGLQSKQIRFEMELARPDLHQCSHCGKLHAGSKENCDECRAKRRRKKKTLEETKEVPAVPVVAAFNDLAEANQKSRLR